MNKNTFVITSFLIFYAFTGFTQSFVNQDSLMNPVGIRKHIEVALFGTFPSVGLGITTYKKNIHGHSQQASEQEMFVVLRYQSMI